jgi:cell wall-associated NlpC family hydrolase
MKRWFLLFINIVIIGIVFFTPHKAYGAGANLSDLNTQGLLNKNVNLQNVQQPNTLPEINENLQKINQAILDNQQAIKATEKETDVVHTDILKLEQELTYLEQKMKKRADLLKERAKAYQVTGGDLSFLNLLLDSANISEFIDRAGTVATIVQADHDLFEKQNAEKEDDDIKHRSLENKLKKLNGLKINYQGMQAQILEQKKHYEDLKIQLQQQNNAPGMTAQSAAPISLNDSTQTIGLAGKILNISQKYIGHSVYVFGGGRSAFDIQNGRFDCSGFVHWALSQVGIDVGTSTDSIKNSGKQVPASSLQPGDLVFFDTYKQDGHVGIYIGNGQFIGSQCTTGVAIADMTSGYWKAKFNGKVIRL